ncbi:class I SAM-dependent methyltransferase [Streptomyces rubiginosohelvolus]|uniref:class I SAM-dependent methyltransferase n=1 Tax=Streptomyces rubiginosohelvolus TaxID=67362 RepID=UPI0036D9F728
MTDEAAPAKSTLPDRSTAGYAEAADTLAVQYEQVTFDAVHRDVLHLLPPAPARILDVGAGTGRDAAALAARGYHCVAAEPTADLRAHGQRIHGIRTVDWVDDALPGLPLLSTRAASTPFSPRPYGCTWTRRSAVRRWRELPRC